MSAQSPTQDRALR